MARPSEYDDTIAEEICRRLAEGESLRKICNSDHMPSRVTVYAWAQRYPAFLNQYRVAREQQADSMIDDAQDIADAADEKTWTVARLRVQTRQWAASKLAPKKYGNLQTVDMTVSQAVVKRDPKDIETKRNATKAVWEKSHGNGADGKVH